MHLQRYAGYLFRWEIRVSLNLIDLFRVALAMRGNEKHPLIGVQLLAQRTVDRMFAKILRLGEKRNRLGTTLSKMIAAAFRRAKTVGRKKRIGRLDSVCPVGDCLKHEVIDFLQVCWLSSRTGLHHLDLNQSKQKILCARDMFCDLGNGPAGRPRFEVQLR